MPNSAPEHEDFVTTQEAARQLGVSVRSIQLWVENGVLHAWKTAGGHRRIARASVDELLAQQREVIETVTGIKLVSLLVIEPNAAYRELYRLKVEGWQLPVTVTSAGDGFQGLIAAGRCDPQIIVTRLELEGIDGFRLIRALRESLPEAELIVLSDLDEREIDAAGGLPERAERLSSVADLDRLEAVLRAKVRTFQGGRARKGG